MENSPQFEGCQLSSSPGRRRTDDIHCDRYIPSRVASDLETGLSLLDDENEPPVNAAGLGSAPRTPAKENSEVYKRLLHVEMLGSPSTPSTDDEPVQQQSPERKVLFRYRTGPEQACESSLTASPVLLRSFRGAEALRRNTRDVPSKPYRILDAPQIRDDFYLNLLDWSSLNLIAVGLGDSVFIRNQDTNRVSLLSSLSPDVVTSVKWAENGRHLAVGTMCSDVQLWDVETNVMIRQVGGHRDRVGIMAWNDNLLSTGSRDGRVLHRDVREPADWNFRSEDHGGEVCGLAWSPDQQQLATGSNDGDVRLWSLDGIHSKRPRLKLAEYHRAAVRAIAWSPHQRGLVATGGGVSDQVIRFCNALTDTPTKSFSAGSQVCNLHWARNANEVVSTHGYSNNEIIVWRYPCLTRIASLRGHAARVLHLAASPDGRCLVTGAADETLRFWEVFPPRHTAVSQPSFFQTIR
mmetsp:Transcript_64557/g.154226  ORF Transcript_64557/g.154226 Transcript_64557/m.154226 type:complete len:464 (-) Transcript_64557:22-1413(-)